MQWYVQVLEKYAVFHGRASRSEFWWFFLIDLFLRIAFGLADFDLGTQKLFWEMGLLSTLYWVATILPHLSVTVRRFHDTGHSGWWYFVIFVPLFGAISLIVLLATNGAPGENQYGPDPKTDTSAES